MWDKDKKSCKTKLEYIGTIDEEGNLVPKRMKLVKANVTEDGNEKLSVISSSRIGMVRPLARICEETGLSEVLEECFPLTHDTLLSLAMYHAASGSNAAYLFPLWQEDHECPIGSDSLTSQDISRLYASVDEARIKEFLRRWRSRASSGNSTFHDITSISSYSKDNELVEYGYNRDKEDLPQINLAMVVDSGNRLPLYYKVHEGSITDVTTLKGVLGEGFAFNMKKLTFVMDKGFFSVGNIGRMYSFGYHFIVSMSLASNRTCEAIDKVRDSLRHPRNIITTSAKETFYAMSMEDHWNSEGMHRPCRIHVFTKDIQDLSLRSRNLDLRLQGCYEELNRGEFIDVHAPLYARYFTETVNEDGTKSYDYNDESIRNSENRYSGYLAIVTDQMEMSSLDVIELYRDKDGVEKVFDDVKNTQDCRRLGIHNHRTLAGKMFVLFLASILISEVRQRMKTYEGNGWSFDSIRRALDKITYTKVKLGHNKRPKDLYSDIPAKSRLILASLLKVDPKDVEDSLSKIIV